MAMIKRVSFSLGSRLACGAVVMQCFNSRRENIVDIRMVDDMGGRKFVLEVLPALRNAYIHESDREHRCLADAVAFLVEKLLTPWYRVDDDSGIWAVRPPVKRPPARSAASRKAASSVSRKAASSSRRRAGQVDEGGRRG